MIVRGIKPEDFEEVIALGKILHESSERKHLQFDEDGCRKALAKCLVVPKIAAFVAEREGRIVGLVVAAENRWAHIKGRYVNDLVFFSAYPGAGGMLLDRLVEWGRERGVDEAICAVSFGGKSAESSKAFFVRRGFTYRGGMFAMNLRT